MPRSRGPLGEAIDDIAAPLASSLVKSLSKRLCHWLHNFIALSSSSRNVANLSLSGELLALHAIT